MIMVIELKPKCYTCLNPIALADIADLTSCPSSDLDHQKLLSD